ncbi:MAG TPA: mechanosensitive ion channel family protein [Longimicrobiales bacterium]|nr:mechanosensitive ion channel family protein [Longimicrobiales bacterium]
MRLRFDWNDLLQWDQITKTAAQILLIVLVAVVAYRLIRLLVRRMVSHEIDSEDPVVKRLREQRAQTLGSLLNNVAFIVIVTFAALTILGTFVEIGPLLAGVGVIGLAISFGAQSLVKDVISGTFILLEGQFGIGDVVRIGDTAGLVEKITLRTSTLRDAEGVVHIIPNGEITKVANLTKTWSRTVIDIGVAYKEEVDRVIAVLRDLGEQIHADPQWSELLLEPPEVLGVQALEDSAVIIRMQTKTLPLKQWEVGRELRRRIKNRFDAEHIEIPYPHVTVYWGDHQAPNGEIESSPRAKAAGRLS